MPASQWDRLVCRIHGVGSKDLEANTFFAESSFSSGFGSTEKTVVAPISAFQKTDTAKRKFKDIYTVVGCTFISANCNNFNTHFGDSTSVLIRADSYASRSTSIDKVSRTP